MCSLAVFKMAEDVSPTGQSTRQPLHPFFAPNRGIPPISNKPPADKGCEPTDTAALLPSLDTDGKPREVGLESAGSRQTKRRKVDTDENDGELVKKKRGRKPKNRSAESIASQPVTLGKGIKSAGQGILPSSAKPQVVDTNGLVVSSGADCQSHMRDGEATTAREPQSQIYQSLQPQQHPTSASNNSTHLKPKKMLLFNPKTGTIGSPPKPKQPVVVGSNTDDDSRSPKSGKSTTRIVKMTYGSDPESRSRIGARINAILSEKLFTFATGHQEPVVTTKQVNSSPEVVKAKAPKPARATTHPFFLGKKGDIPAEEPKNTKVNVASAPKRTKQFTSTPCSPKKPRAEAPTAPAMRMPQFGSKPPGLKFPGSKLPAWPWKDMVHVRGDEEASQDVDRPAAVLTCRKSKGHSVKVSTFESVIDSITRNIEVPVLAEVVRNVNTDEFLPAPPELRLPRKHFESGSKLQARIIPELKTFQSLVTAKKSRLGRGKLEVDRMDTSPHPPPQLTRIFGSIRSGLSAFDISRCETSNWTQKYAPTSAVEVLQPGKEAYLLRDWLQALMVQSVDTGSTEAEKSKSSKAKTADAGKKKRRKKLDGFIVSSGDEDYELAELADVEEEWTPNGIKGAVRKTVVRSGDLAKMRDGVKIANTLVISGPHGCGKTAAVYAVAKELNFEVFEINSGSRRSGKDIMEKIGDMTRNHLVQHHKSPNPPPDQGEADVNVTDDELAKDLKSGKQATMNAFFKPKLVPPKPEDTAKAPTATVQPKEANKKANRESSKNQRQSLILLEEVDILYAEDKVFWVTVMELIAQSKRPFIMTCNDEALVPLQSLRLHGIFRFSPPPRELAIDRLLLTAANEGHALTRQAVETLYESRKQDLRAATMDLQYWCQIGVGDRRGGFDWFYPRWPKGVDLDENKEVVRVVSEGTYQAGMSWLGRDTVVDPKASSRAIEEELVHQTWETWGLDIGRWQDSVGLSSWATSITPVTSTSEGRLSVLESFDSLTEALSVADVCSCRSFAMFKEEILDTTLPEPSAKAEEDVILGFSFLDTHPVSHYDSLVTSLPSTIKSLAKSSLRARTEALDLQNQVAEDLVPLDEPKVVDYINTSFKSPLPGTAGISRLDFAFAFDPISESDSSPGQPVSYLDPSVFDRNLNVIVLDVAPYVRGIVAYDSRLQKQRLKLSNLVSEGGKLAQGSKRMRTTRAALSALEGGSRSTTRGEKWFKADINPYFVMKTAGQGWDGYQEEEEESPVARLRSSSPESSPAKPIKKYTGKRRGRKKKVVLEDDSGDDLANDVDTSTLLV